MPFPDWRLNPHPLHWKGGVLTAGLLGKTLYHFFFFKIPRRSDNVWYLSFSAWLTSFSRVTSRSIHVAANGITSPLSYGWVISHCVHAPHFLYPFICWWTLGCFYVLSTLNSLDFIPWDYLLGDYLCKICLIAEKFENFCYDFFKFGLILPHFKEWMTEITGFYFCCLMASITMFETYWTFLLLFCK